MSAPVRLSSGFGGGRPERSSGAIGALRASRAAQAAVALTVLAAGLRFGTLDVQSVWLDESATMVLVRRSFGSMLSHLSGSESTPPLYYVLAWGWTRALGSGVMGFRSFSALIGTATVPIMYVAGSRISPKAGVWAALLTSVNPLMYYYSQEARAYALFVLFAAASTVFWLNAMRSEGRPRDLAWWAAMSILGLATHYFTVFLFLPQALILVRALGASRLRLPVGAFLIAGLALLPLALSQRKSGQASWIESSSLLSRVAEAPKAFLVGVYGPQEILTALVAAAIVLVPLALLALRWRVRGSASALYLALVAVGGVLIPVMLAFSHLIDVFDGRNVINMWVPFALVFAIAIAAPGAERVNAAAGAALCVLSLAVIVGIDTEPGYQRDDWRGVSEGLALRPGGVVVTPQNGLLPLAIYVPSLQKAGPGRASEISFVGLRVRHTGRSPTPGIVPTKAPAGFRAAGVTRTQTYSISRFVSSAPTRVDLRELRMLMPETAAEVLTRGPRNVGG